MKRPYRQRVRAEKSAETRARILASARARLPAAADFSVEEIARQADVSVPTLYSHFGSKGGLLSALVGEVEREAGLFRGFDAVWASRDGEAALRAMLDATLGFWHHAWTFIEFALRVRRTDPDVKARLRRIDASRLGHLVVICRRLKEEGRLRPGLAPPAAARLAFALSTPYVYEAMVVEGGLPAASARRLAVEAVSEAVLVSGSVPVLDPPADWRRLGLRPPVI